MASSAKKRIEQKFQTTIGPYGSAVAASSFQTQFQQQTPQQFSSAASSVSPTAVAATSSPSAMAPIGGSTRSNSIGGQIAGVEGGPTTAQQKHTQQQQLPGNSAGIGSSGSVCSTTSRGATITLSKKDTQKSIEELINVREF